jgi:hypothetical protein
MSVLPAAALAAADPQAIAWLGPAWPGAAGAAALAPAMLATWPGDRAALMRILVAHGHGPAAALADPRTVAVVCGQQPAVGGGPLYTLVKCATAVAVARAMTAAGTPAVPVFWCASEDHDLGEADHADLVLRDGSVRRIRADLGPGRAALRHRPAAGWEDLTAALSALPDAAVGSAWWRQRRLADGSGWGAWLCRVLAEVFPGLVSIEGHHLRSLWSRQAQALTAHWPAAALHAQREALIAADWPDSFGELPTPPWFADSPTGRTSLPAGSDLADASPGAAIRPILQQAALPCAVFVAGPGELAYHARLGPVYAAAGVPRPLLLHRPTVRIEPGWYRRGCAAWGMDPGTGSDPKASWGSPLPGSGAVADPQASWGSPLPGSGAGAALGHLEAAIAALDPASAAHRRLIGERQRLERELARAARRAAGRPAVGSLQRWLTPREDTPQDRVMTLAQALWTWGPGVGPAMVEAVVGAAPGAVVTLAV